MKNRAIWIKGWSALSALSSGLKKDRLVQRSFRHIRRKLFAFLSVVSPVMLANFRFYKAKGRRLDLQNPKDFDEKLLWQMLNWRHPLKTTCADKYSMRLYVEKHGFGYMLPTLLGVYNQAKDIDFDLLPMRFVLKCTHGCGFNIFCKDKSRLDIIKTIRQLDAWIKEDFSRVYGEIHYRPIRPRIICEEFLGDSEVNLPVDYKVYCFNGKAFCTNACLDRGEDGQGAIYFIYDLAWEHKLPFEKSSLGLEKEIPPPPGYEEMIRAAEALSEPFPFVRVDFYSLKGRVIIGEMTFTPSGCIDEGLTEHGQRRLGELLVLPRERIK